MLSLCWLDDFIFSQVNILQNSGGAQKISQLAKIDWKIIKISKNLIKNHVLNQFLTKLAEYIGAQRAPNFYIIACVHDHLDDFSTKNE